ncbi:MAG: phage tail protein [Clostridia bacterium]|nr:phage tail protein [Clostridia bacterium]
MEGYYTGILDVYYALITTAETATTKPVYGDPKVMGKTIEVTITPNYKEGSVYASNVATRNEKRVDSYTVSVNVDKLAYEVRQELLGRQVDANGVQIINGSQKAPDVAVGFAITLDDDSKELWWLYKGTFAEPTSTAHTASDSITYQHPTIEGKFVRRECDNALAAVCDTVAVSDKLPAAITTWFTAVYEAAAEDSGK